MEGKVFLHMLNVDGQVRVWDVTRESRSLIHAMKEHKGIHFVNLRNGILHSNQEKWFGVC